jgi:hypothetical protein
MPKRFKYLSNILSGFAVVVGSVAQPGCSSEEPPSAATGKVSRREEAGKKFPFPEGGSPTQGASGSGKAPSR